MDALLRLPIIDSPAMWVVYGGAVVLALVLLARPARDGWWVRASLGLVGGAITAVVLFLVANVVEAFGTDLPLAVAFWAVACFAAVGLAIVSFPRARAWRRVIAGVAVIWFLVSGVVGVNAYAGLNPTLGSLLGVVVDTPIDVPGSGGAAAAPDQPIYTTWTAPNDLATVGKQGTENIPGTESGFVARPAGIYLPPAALASDAPALPLVIMMMGYPGNPDVSFIAGVLDQYAADHAGLAPIVIVADQIGGTGSDQDPACADSAAYGAAETYITKDVAAWARANLRIIDDPRYWVIAGYSNGGGCAIKYGAAYPGEFSNIIDVSGEEFPGSEDVSGVLETIYGGDQAAFDASKPINIMASAPPGAYANTTAVFTAGSEDPGFIAASQTVAAAAVKAGMSVTSYVVPGADHLVSAITGGLDEGFAVLYPVLGLSAP